MPPRIFDNSGIVAVVTDSENIITDCNQAATDFFSQNHNDLAGENLLALIDNGDRIFIESLAAKIIDGSKKNIQLEKPVMVISESGFQEKWIRIDCNIYGSDNKYLIYLIQDITAQQKSAIKEKQTEKNLNNILSAMADGFLLFDSNGQLLDFSPSIHDLFPQVQQSLIPKMHIAEVYSKIIYSQNIIDALDNEQTYLQEWQTKQITGSYKLFFKHKNQKNYLLQYHQSPNQSILTFTDVTMIREKETLLATLASENSHLSKAVDATQVGIAICDARLPLKPIIYFNHAFHTIVGHAAEKVIGENIGVLFNAESDQTAIRQIESALENNAVADVETKAVDAGHRTFWCHIQINPIIDVTGICTHFVLMLTDISRRKNQEQELIQAKRAADEANKAKSQFLAIMSHEIKTPINGVMGMVDLLMTSNPNEKQQQFLSTAKESAGKLLGLVNDILDYSDLESNHLAIKPKPVDLNELIRRSLADIKEDAFKKNLSLQFLLDPKIPKKLYGDPDRIAQIVRNIVGNSIKFTERGHIEVHLNLLSETNKTAKLQLKIIDTGIGIAPDKLNSIFDPFHQIDLSFTRKYSGTGLGLAICKKLLQLMHGDISAKSTLGSGTTINCTLSLPLHPPEHSVNGNSEGKTTNKKKILIVDDSMTNRMIPASLLRPYGFEIHEADGGKKAIDLASTHDYDLILMDIAMPEIDGIAATRAIISAKPGRQVKIIAITAHSSEQEKTKCIRAGMIDYLTKPVDKEKLLAACFNVMNISFKNGGVMENKNMLDETILHQLENDIGDKTLRTLLDAFIEETVERLKLIRQFSREQKWEYLGREGHTLKSTSGSFGLMTLCDKSSQLDELCRTQNYIQAELTAAEIANMGGECIGTLRKWMVEKLPN